MWLHPIGRVCPLPLLWGSWNLSRNWLHDILPVPRIPALRLHHNAIWFDVGHVTDRVMRAWKTGREVGRRKLSSKAFRSSISINPSLFLSNTIIACLISGYLSRSWKFYYITNSWWRQQKHFSLFVEILFRSFRRWSLEKMECC